MFLVGPKTRIWLHEKDKGPKFVRILSIVFHIRQLRVHMETAFTVR